MLQDLPHLPPYPSTPPPFISPSPYPSFPILLHPFLFLPPTLIPPPTNLRHLPTAGLHSTLHLKGSSHSLCCPTFPLSPVAWYILCPLPLSGIVGLMAYRSWVKCPSSWHTQVFSTISICLLPVVECKLILLLLSALFIMRSLRSEFF